MGFYIIDIVNLFTCELFMSLLLHFELFNKYANIIR